MQFSETPEDFLPIMLGTSSETVLGRTLMILQEASASHENIDDLLPLLDELETHLWRSPAIQALSNARRNLPIIRSGIRVVATGTDTELTQVLELQAVSLQITIARRRIGGAVRDLEEELSKLFGQRIED